MHSSRRRKEREKKKICWEAEEYNSSCRGPCEERVIAMTHWCNPFKTLWLGPRLLWLPLQACAIIFISDTFRWLPAISPGWVNCLVVHLLCLPGGHLVLDALQDWQERAKKKKKKTHRKDNDQPVSCKGEARADPLVHRRVICLERCRDTVDPPNLTRQWA